MAVARISNSEHILLGEVGESFSGALTSVAVTAPVQLPIPIDVTIGSDGLLLVARSTIFGPSVTLDQWLGVEPYVSGEVYFIPWEGIRGLDTGSTESSHSAVVVHHVNGSHTSFELDTVTGPGRLMDASRGLPEGSRDLASDPALWADIARVLVETPLLSEEEILQILREDYEWSQCTRSVVDEILWDDDSSSYFHAHVWFVDEEAIEETAPLGDFVDEVIEVLSADVLTAEGILENIVTEGVELADVYDVLLDPSVPVFTRKRAWYFDGEIEGEDL